jgi:hypothetical protein
MRRESVIPFLPAALAAVADALTTGFVLGHQPDYPGRVIVFQIVMFGAALLAAVPNKWVRFVGFVLTAGRGVHHRLFGGDSLSSGVLCVRVGNGERCAATADGAWNVRYPGSRSGSH